MAGWDQTKVLVTGGASFIGSHLVEALLARGAEVRVADNLTSGTLENLDGVRDSVDFHEVDLRDEAAARRAVDGCHVVFHLAADHGGRGYIDLHEVACASNFALDQVVFGAALEAGVGKLVFASSGCVYPLHLQGDVGETLYLTEDMVGPPYAPDGLYGLAKVAGERTLAAMHREHRIGAASCRYFTVYGPRGVENHAVMAMIARAFVKEDPFEIWGTGEQLRNWTYVDDIVRGTVLAAECIEDGTAVNIGTNERTSVREAAELVLGLTGHTAEIRTRPDMPVGPLNRIADNTRSRELLGFAPEVMFREGVQRTIEWYFASKDPAQVAERLPWLLTERGDPPTELAAVS